MSVAMRRQAGAGADRSPSPPTTEEERLGRHTPRPVDEEDMVSRPVGVTPRRALVGRQTVAPRTQRWRRDHAGDVPPRGRPRRSGGSTRRRVDAAGGGGDRDTLAESLARDFELPDREWDDVAEVLAHCGLGPDDLRDAMWEAVRRLAAKACREAGDAASEPRDDASGRVCGAGAPSGRARRRAGALHWQQEAAS